MITRIFTFFAERKLRKLRAENERLRADVREVKRVIHTRRSRRARRNLERLAAMDQRMRAKAA